MGLESCGLCQYASKMRERAPERMFAAIQFPLVDFRRFGYTHSRLSRPTWPSPIPRLQFVRGVGPVRDRPKGAAGLGLGEQSFCEANKLVKFSSDPSQNLAGPIIPSFRRLFGSEGGYRVDVGMRFYPRQLESVWDDAAHSVLDLKVHVGEGPATLLFDAGRHLALRLDELTSPSNRNLAGLDGKVDRAWSGITSCRPLVILEYGSATDSETMSAFSITRMSENISVYALPKSDRGHGRLLRSAVWRLHFEIELLKAIAVNYDQNSSSCDKEWLDGYLNICLSKLAKKRRGGFEQGSILRLAESIQGFNRTELSSLAKDVRGRSKGLAKQLDLLLDASRNTYILQNNSGPHIEMQSGNSVKINIEEGITMGDSYKNIKNSSLTVRSHNTSQIPADVDLGKLAEELELLRQEAKKTAETPENDEAVAEIGKARRAAEAGDGEKAKSHLRTAGDWALAAAERIGLQLAETALKAALGS